MTLNTRLRLLLVACMVLLSVAGCSREPFDTELTLTEAQRAWVGEQIFRNECGGRVACLVHWNRGEAFPSLGIGHFIWYPEGVEGRFVESFPALIDYLRERDVELPLWLAELEPLAAPWPDRDTFLLQQDSLRVHSLREFLGRTRSEQVGFMFGRARASLSRVVEAAPEETRGKVAQRLTALSATPGGVYVLIDYVNFKGEGLAAGESYKGQGWGLLQVLQEMQAGDGGTALIQFRQAAGRVLTRRAHNAENPIERDQWLRGWLNRLETYREPADRGR